MSIQSFTEAMGAAYAALTDAQKDALDEGADASCSGGSDSDGSSIFEIFENGYELGRSLKEGDSVFGNWDARCEGVFFYVGTEESVLERIRTAEVPPPSA